MEFVVSKENIQPLRGGRNAAQLEVGLQAQHNPQVQQELLQQRQQFENAINNYVGDDPLDNFYHYIYWVEQSFPKNGHESNLPTLLEDCLKQFENENRYYNDRRFCNLWIKYIDMQQNPTELYQLLYAKRICIGCAEMYKAWAYYYEAAGNYQRADMVFKLAKDEIAQPFHELEAAHDKFIRNLGMQTINQVVDSKQLSEQRQALTKLQTYRSGQVGSVRVASTSGAGVLPLTVSPAHSQPPVNVFQDYRDILYGGGLPPASILSAVKRDAPKENMMDAGAWTGVKRKTHTTRKCSNIQIHEDAPVPPHILGIQLPLDHVPSTSEDFSTFNVPICVPDPDDPNKIAMYCKKSCYMDASTEFSIEEVRARRYLRTMKRQLSVGSVSEMDHVVQRLLPSEDFRGHSEFQQCFPQAAHISAHTTEITSFSTASTSSMHPIQFSNIAHHQVHVTSPQHSHPQSYVSLAPNSQSPIQMQRFHPGSSFHLPSPPHMPMEMMMNPLMAENAAFNEPKPYANLTQQSPSASMRTFGDVSHLHVPPPACQTRVSPEAPSPVFNYTDFWPQEEAVQAQPMERQQAAFALYEESPQISVRPRQQAGVRGSAMKTPLNVLSYDELAETGSRGGLDIAAIAQPTDVARCLPIDDDNSMQGYGDTTTTELFGLGNMCVSTPNNKQVLDATPPTKVKISKKLNFAAHALKTISEEKSSTTSLCGNPALGNTLDGEVNYHYNLSQNMKANADLRSKIGMHTPSATGNYAMRFQPAEEPLKQHEEADQEHVPYAVLDLQPSDPFTNRVLEAFLAHVSFPGRHRKHYTQISGVPKLAVRKEPCCIGSERFLVDKLLGKGSYGNVYKATRCDTATVVALKIQKPPNKWEFYICREIQARLRDDPIRENFMNVHRGYFSEQASVLQSDVHHGSLLDLINILKVNMARGQKLHLTIYLTIEMMKLVRALHQISIIHADIKPDNFLIMLRQEQIELQLIDFGCSIDMSLMRADTMFTRKIKTDTFQCCEMKDDRPWSYHTDIFCIAATAHVLLLDHYIEVKKTDGYWQITRKIPRYFREDLWAPFFNTMMNMQHGLPDLRGIINEFSEALDPRDLRTASKNVINLLRKR